MRKRLRHRGFELLCALEDDPRNVEMYAEAGVPCVYVYSGYYEGRSFPTLS